MVVFSLLSRFLLLITAQLRNPQRDPNSTSTLGKSHAPLNNTGRIASDHDRFSAAARGALCRTRFIRAFFENGHRVFRRNCDQLKKLERVSDST
jgi:hypothetical protein